MVRRTRTRQPCLTMRLSDAELRRLRSKLIHPAHRFPPWLTEDPSRSALAYRNWRTAGSWRSFQNCEGLVVADRGRSQAGVGLCAHRGGAWRTYYSSNYMRASWP